MQLDLKHWKPVPPAALPSDGVRIISEKLMAAKKPLVVTSWLGRSHEAFLELIKLAEALEMPVLDATPFNVNFPTQHRLYAGSQWNSPGQNQWLAEADVVLVLDTDSGLPAAATGVQSDMSSQLLGRQPPINRAQTRPVSILTRIHSRAGCRCFTFPLRYVTPPLRRKH